jgi:Leucine-rich repeat (LRR) protein
MVGLKRLILNKNQLSNIPDLTFENNKKLEVLEIENNGLTEVTQAQIHGLGGSLKTLNIKGNSIKLIDKCVIEELTDLTMMLVHPNPSKGTLN